MTDPDQMREHMLTAIAAAAGLDALEAVRIEALGKQGRVTHLLKTLGGMTPEERRVQGPLLNGLREAVATAIAARKATLEQIALDARLAGETLDLTLPVDAPPAGTVHPVSQAMDELAEIVADLGFAIATGPEIEDDRHHAATLDPSGAYPARAMHDAFYCQPQAPAADGAARMLRTHPSPLRVGTLLANKPPLRIIAQGRVYRADRDATHTPMAHQIEGLVIDRGITLGHLRWTLEAMLKAFFARDDVALRLRPGYFPFTEPSAAVDVGFTTKDGKRTLGGSPDPDNGGWMELLGGGMIRPEVIAARGLDPAEWQGFAFGVGVDRLAMLKYGIDDLRSFFEADVRWSKHYGFSAFDVPTVSGGMGA